MRGTFECKYSDGGEVCRKYVFESTDFHEKNLDEDTLLLFRTAFNAKGHFNLVCCAEQSLESEATDDLIELLSDLKLRFTMVVIHYNL